MDPQKNIFYDPPKRFERVGLHLKILTNANGKGKGKTQSYNSKELSANLDKKCGRRWTLLQLKKLVNKGRKKHKCKWASPLNLFSIS